MSLADSEDILHELKTCPGIRGIPVYVNVILQFAYDIGEFSIRAEGNLTRSGLELAAYDVGQLEPACSLIEIIELDLIHTYIAYT